MLKRLFLCFLLLGKSLSFASAQNSPRITIPLLATWRTAADDKNQQANPNFEQPTFNDQSWQTVTVPHNWDAYEGYRRQRHGNRHGYAWYRKTFAAPAATKDARYFLFFEGVSSYATVWLNGQQVGSHAGGRTTFTLDVTAAIQTNGRPNLLAVRADHPANIQDLPWVCGGCSEERGFSEGSQPMGIFRPVALVVTNAVRVEPFGVHIWADSSLSAQAARLNVETDVRNYGRTSQSLNITSQLLDRQGKVVAEMQSKQKLAAGITRQIRQQLPVLKQPHLWSLADPYLYRLITKISAKGRLLDELETPYGIRWVSWPIGKSAATQKQFLLNGKPVFINGIAEYEHLLGQSHAFSDAQIRTRVQMVKAAGFNAFRDAHQPHNLRYQANWDSLGLLWWPQLAAHVWYDTPAFRQNFKTLLTDWVKERRNSPSVVLWGLENESTLPADFARECSALIRQLDPTASRERKITTCNGGQGTDWDVPQNWTGTYGGDPATYAADVQRQVLIGEYGAWRTLDLHTEGPPVLNGGPFSEDRMTQLMEQKVRLAESARDQTAGHFFWLLTSHDNPGRVQGGEGQRELDRIGPVNYKGLLTPWEEPTDAFYMFRANYAPKNREPMVYIVSHTWPDRWLTPGRKDSITVYSNCDEVELFNDVNAASLGRKTRAGGIGTHFQWDGVNINYNVLYAVGYVGGKAVAKDYIVLHHLPKAPNFDEFLADAQPITQPKAGLNYLFRVNCGGPAYTDRHGSIWQADQPRTGPETWGSESWTQDFPGLSPFFASQRRTHDPIGGTTDWPLFQDFRYGRKKLRYAFPVPNGEYSVELYFAEPWLGTGGGLDCTGWRLFDVAFNGETILKNLDIWKEAGHDQALKKTVKARVIDGQLVITFPHVASGQALISAIAIATTDAAAKPAPAPQAIISNLQTADPAQAAPLSAQTWLDTGTPVFADAAMSFSSLPSVLFGAEWLRGSVKGATVAAAAKASSVSQKTSKPNHSPNSLGSASPPERGAERARASFTVTTAADVYIALDARQTTGPDWLKEYEDTKTTLATADATGTHLFRVYRRRFPAGATVALGPNGSTPIALPYIVAVNRASTIEPAYDLKAITGYKPATARVSGPGMVKEPVNTKESITFKEASGGAVEWTIQVGVADTYSLTFRYANQLARPLTGKLTVALDDGTVLKTEAVALLPSKPGKWNYLATSTGGMINAGSYRVKLTGTDAAGLSISGLDVQ